MCNAKKVNAELAWTSAHAEGAIANSPMQFGPADHISFTLTSFRGPTTHTIVRKIAAH